MARANSFGDRMRVFARVAADAVTYAIAATAVIAVLAVVLAVATGGGLVRTKYLLFVAGWLLLTYATFRLWPSSPEDVEPNANRSQHDSLPREHESSRFQRLVLVLPPRRWVQSPRPKRRITIPGKLLLTALLILLLSFAMETVFGVV